MSAESHHHAANRRRWIALAVVCLAMLMNTLDGSVVNVALPAIGSDLHIPQNSLTWVVNAYLIAFGSFLLMAGRMGDLVGPQARLPDRRHDLHASPPRCAASPAARRR